jgi:hypothetical protein
MLARLPPPAAGYVHPFRVLTGAVSLAALIGAYAGFGAEGLAVVTLVGPGTAVEFQGRQLP